MRQIGEKRAMETIRRIHSSACPFVPQPRSRPLKILQLTGLAERTALIERYAAKLASFTTSAQEDESILSGKRSFFGVAFCEFISAETGRQRCGAPCDERAAHSTLKNHRIGLRDQTAWKTRLLVEFRLLRKRALQPAIDELRATPEGSRDEL